MPLSLPTVKFTLVPLLGSEFAGKNHINYHNLIDNIKVC